MDDQGQPLVDDGAEPENPEPPAPEDPGTPEDPSPERVKEAPGAENDSEGGWGTPAPEEPETAAEDGTEGV